MASSPGLGGTIGLTTTESTIFDPSADTINSINANAGIYTVWNLDSTNFALVRNPGKAADLGVTVREADYDRPETLAIVPKVTTLFAKSNTGTVIISGAPTGQL